jgi:DNA-directed RNA polymerase subunit RPC12/RpoP
MNKQIEYKHTYNEGRGLPEPLWGLLMSDISPKYPLECPTCGSLRMFASAHPDDPEEIFPHETVRCRDCGHITDWREAFCQYREHHSWLSCWFSYVRGSTKEFLNKIGL